jgi:hypothetical protein
VNRAVTNVGAAILVGSFDWCNRDGVFPAVFQGDDELGFFVIDDREITRCRIQLERLKRLLENSLQYEKRYALVRQHDHLQPGGRLRPCAPRNKPRMR